jgi:hypothetical protein
MQLPLTTDVEKPCLRWNSYCQSTQENRCHSCNRFCKTKGITEAAYDNCPEDGNGILADDKE